MRNSQDVEIPLQGIIGYILYPALRWATMKNLVEVWGVAIIAKRNDKNCEFRKAVGDR